MSNNLTDCITRYSERGWALVPIAGGTKIPLVKGWTTITPHTDTAKTLFDQHPNCNVGLVLGLASGGLVDIDCDHAFAGYMAQQICPPTPLVFGRRSKPMSHRIYRVPDPGRVETFCHPETGAMLIELRGNGHQTVIPPSIHESGEAVSFAEGGDHGDPATSDWNALKRCCALIATALVFIDHWQRGQRHDLALSLAGLLAQSAATEAEAHDLIKAIVHVTGDEEMSDRMTCVTTTFNRARSGLGVSIPWGI